MEPPDQAPALAPTLRAPQCGIVWGTTGNCFGKDTS
jgi:hypothetical protein